MLLIDVDSQCSNSRYREYDRGLINLNIVYSTITKDENYIFIAAGRIGLVVFGVSDWEDPQLLQFATHSYSKVTSSTCVYLDNTENYVYVTYSDVGVFVFDVSNRGNPFVVSQLVVGGGEDIKLSKDNKIGILSARSKGLFIIDTSNHLKIE